MGRLNGMVSPLFLGGILDSWHRHCDGISNFVSRPLFEAYDVILVSTLSKLYTRNVFSVWHILYIIIVSQWRHSDTFILFIYCCRWHFLYNHVFRLEIFWAVCCCKRMLFSYSHELPLGDISDHLLACHYDVLMTMLDIYSLACIIYIMVASLSTLLAVYSSGSITYKYLPQFAYDHSRVPREYRIVPRDKISILCCVV